MVQKLPCKGDSRQLVQLLVSPLPGSGGKPRPAYLHGSTISHAHVENPSAMFSCGDTVRALVVAVGQSNGVLSLSTKWLEKKPGEVHTARPHKWDRIR